MERFEYVSSLGEGAYGVVWLCIDRETNQKVAMKRFKDAHTDAEVMRLALREVRLLKAAQHPNVVKMLEAFRSKSGRVYIAMEYVERTLTQDLRKFHGKGFPPLLAKMLTYQLLQATKHLHSRKVMHRDLKPANILINSDYDLKLCDFGFARTLHPRETAEYTTYVVTRWYRAPEILVSDAYGPKVDVWAIGCLLGEMAGGRPMFPGKSSADQMWLTKRTLGSLPHRQEQLLALDKLYTGAVWPTPEERTTISKRFPQFPEDLMNLLHHCLSLDPNQRYSAEEALAHPYFADVPQIQEAIAATNRPASEFWAVIEEAWLEAVGNANVSSSEFMKTSKSHSQITTLLNTRELDDSDESCQTTPHAPLGLMRRGLTGHSLSSTAPVSQDIMGSSVDIFATGTSICVPSGPSGFSFMSDTASRQQSQSGLPSKDDFPAPVSENYQQQQLALRQKSSRSTGTSIVSMSTGDGGRAFPVSSGPTPSRSRLAMAQSCLTEEQEYLEVSNRAKSEFGMDAGRGVHDPSGRSWTTQGIHAVASDVQGAGSLHRARSLANPGRTGEHSESGHKGSLDASQTPEMGGFLNKLKTKFKTFLGQPQPEKLEMGRDARAAMQTIDKVVPPLGDTHLITTHVDVM